MSFLQPDRLWLLLVVPALVAGYVLLQHRRSRYAVRFTNVPLLDTVAPRRMRWRQHVAVLLALVTVTGATLLFAQPAGLVKVPRRTPVTVVLTMDISLSMAARDVPPSRIVAAKRTAKSFLAKLPSDYQVALVTFARHATVVVPPTVNRSQVDRAIDGLHLKEYTATGEGIFTALAVAKQALAGQPKTSGQKPAMVLLISDGKRTVGRSQVTAAEAAKRQGVPVDTVALGTPGGIIEAEGQVVSVPVEVGELAQVARISGGKAYVAGSLPSLAHAYRQVSGGLAYTTEWGDLTSQYIGWLVLASLLSAAAGLLVASRWP